MRDALLGLSERYARLLKAHMERPGEAMLEEAYEIGRSAIAAELGVLDMVMIHHEALGRLAGGPLPTTDPDHLGRAAQFFGESLSAYEMMLRGYRETNARLVSMNDELQRTQTQLVQSAKMASLGELVAGIAHEINNPLSFAVIHQDIAQRLLRDASPSPEKLQKLRDNLLDMQSGLNRISDIVTNLRTFSRLDEGRFADVDINAGIDSVLMLLEHKFKGRIAIRKEYCQNAHLYCTPSINNQVVMNLISNAIDAIEGEGAITLQTSRSDDRFCISVSDTGSGIAADIRDRIFEPFFTTKPVGSGTGLGLAISYGIVETHHGTIDVDSEPGNTTFTVRLPIVPAPADQ